MRAKEFLIDQIINDSQVVLEDINGNINYCHYIELMDSELSESSLFEQLSSDDVDYIKSLKSYSAIPKIGEYYAPVMAFLLPSDLKFFGDKQPLQLTRIRNDSGVEVYDFVDDSGKVKTYPDTRLTEKSYAELFLFNDAQVYLKFKLAITLKFKDATLPNITFSKSVNEIAKIPQGDFGDADTLTAPEYDIEKKELPGGAGFTYAVNKTGTGDLEIMIFDGNKLAAELDLFETQDVTNAWRVSTVAVNPQYRGRGLGKALYGIALSILKLTLEAGDTQTRHGQQMWLMLNSIPGVEVQGYNMYRTGQYKPRPGDEIIAQDDTWTRYTFPVKPGVHGMRSARHGTGIYSNPHVSMIAKWTGQ
jgi:GNAT superfamily N-acetyltransferase